MVPIKYNDFLNKILHSNDEYKQNESGPTKIHEAILIPKLLHLKDDKEPKPRNAPKVLASSSDDLSNSRGSATTLNNFPNLIGLLAALLAMCLPRFFLNY